MKPVISPEWIVRKTVREDSKTLTENKKSATKSFKDKLVACIKILRSEQ